MSDKTQPAISRIVELNGEVFEVLEHLGEGGMGTVYKARQSSLDRIVAVKVLHKRVMQSQSAVERLQLEAKALARMHHPSIVKVFTLMMMAEERQPFLVLEYVEGHTLKELLAQQQVLDEKQFKRIFEQVLAALGLAHHAGIVHRDLKPSNIMVGPDLTVKVMDFGIAKALNDDSVDPQVATTSGNLVGSPAYMSPEQCHTGSIDARADLYAVGCCMFEALSGDAPFRGDTALETMYMQLHQRPNLEHPKIERRYRQMLAMALEKSVSRRFADAAEFGAALSDALSNKSGSILPVTNYGARRSAGLWKIQMIMLGIAAATCVFIVLAMFGSHNKSLQANQEPPMPPSLSLARAEAGKLLEAMGDDFRTPQTEQEIRAAAARFQAAIDHYKDNSESGTVVKSYMDLGHLYRRVDRQRCEESFERAAAYAAKMRPNLVRFTQNMLGQEYVRNGKFERARESFEKSLALAKDQGALALESDSWVDLAGVELREGHHKKALTDLQSAEFALLHASQPSRFEERLWSIRQLQVSHLCDGHDVEDAMKKLLTHRRTLLQALKDSPVNVNIRLVQSLIDNSYGLQERLYSNNGDLERMRSAFVERCLFIDQSSKKPNLANPIARKYSAFVDHAEYLMACDKYRSEAARAFQDALTYGVTYGILNPVQSAALQERWQAFGAANDPQIRGAAFTKLNDDLRKPLIGQ